MVKRILILTLSCLLLAVFLGCASDGAGRSDTRRQPGNLPYWAQPTQYDEWGHPGVDPWEP